MQTLRILCSTLSVLIALTASGQQPIEHSPSLDHFPLSRNPFDLIQIDPSLANAQSSERLRASGDWEKIDIAEGGWTDDVVNVNGRLFMNNYTQLYFSDDGGVTWNKKIAASPNVNDYGEKQIQVSGNHVLFRDLFSSDGGETWTKFYIYTQTLPTWYFNATDLLLAGPDLFLGTRYNGIFKSTDLGVTFTDANSGYPSQYGYRDTPLATGLYNSLPVVATANGIFRYQGSSWVNCTGTGIPKYNNGTSQFYLITEIDFSGPIWFASAHDGVYRSSNQGSTWQKTALPDIDPPVGLNYVYLDWTDWPKVFYHLDFADNTIFASFQNTFHFSTDGVTWKRRVLSTAADIRGITMWKNKIVVATTAGIFTSEDSGLTWNESNSGLNGIGISNFLTTDTTIYVCSYGSGIYKSTDEGRSWSKNNSGLPTLRTGLLTDGVRTYVNTVETIMYDGTGQGRSEHVLQSNSDRSGWEPVPLNFAADQVLEVASDGVQQIAIGFKGGHRLNGIQYSSDGTSWQNIFQGVTSSPYPDIAVDLLLDEDTLYAGTSVHGIYKTGNHGQTWTPINNGLTIASADLSNLNGLLQVHCLTKLDNSMYFIGEKLSGSYALFYSYDRGNTWSETDFSAVTGSNLAIPIDHMVVTEHEIIVHILITDPNYNLLGSKFLRSTDNKTWEEFGSGFPEIYAFSFKKVGPSILAAGNGSLYRLPLTDETVTFFTHDQTLKNGRIEQIPIRAKQFENILGSQFTLQWDPKVLAFDRVSNFNLPGMDSTDFGFDFVDEGKLTFSWSSVDLTPISLADSSALFSIFLKSLVARDTTQLLINDSKTAIEVVGENLEVLDHRTHAGQLITDDHVSVHGQAKHSQHGVNVNIIALTSLDSIGFQTNPNGEFNFSIRAADNVQLSISKPTDPATFQQFLDAADLVAITRHILGSQLLTNAQELLAADVNRNGSITTLDKLWIQSVILGEKVFDNHAQWLFMVSAHDRQPFSLSTENDADLAVSAVHLGDVFHNESEFDAGRQKNDPINLLVSRQFDGKNLVFTFSSPKKIEVSALQLAIASIPGFEFDRIEASAILPSFYHNDEGVRLVWHEPNGKTYTIGKAQTLFSMHYHIVLENVTEFPIALNASMLSPKAFDKDLSSRQIELWVSSDALPETDIFVWPNPFEREVHFSFYSDVIDTAMISIFDVVGLIIL